MVDTLRCDEVFHHNSPLHNPPGAGDGGGGGPGGPGGLLGLQDLQGLVPQFCHAYRDAAILGDKRVLRNMLMLESHYIPQGEHYNYLQDEIKPHMRQIVADWMLDVCIDQRCHVDVFLLATNIMDRFLATIQLRKRQFQLLGACAIFLASKMIEPTPILASTLVQYTANTYDREELLSMELLILSKLQWDLTAITAYDYVDHLLETLKHRRSRLPRYNQRLLHDDSEEDPEDEEDNSYIDATHLDSLRKHSERLITLCATNSAFLSVPPSTVASAALASALLQDMESQAPTARGVGLKQVLRRIQSYTKVEMTCLRQCIDRIETLFISAESQTNSSGATASSSSHAPRGLSSADGGSSSSSNVPCLPPPSPRSGALVTGGVVVATSTPNKARVQPRLAPPSPSSGGPAGPAGPAGPGPSQLLSHAPVPPVFGTPPPLNAASAPKDVQGTPTKRSSDHDQTTPTEVFRVAAWYVA